MKITKELIAAVLKTSGVEGLPTALEHLQRIESQVAALWSKSHAARKQYDETCSRLESEIAGVQATCPHPLTRHHSDPVGNGGWTECVVCGFDLDADNERGGYDG